MATDETQLPPASEAEEAMEGQPGQDAETQQEEPLVENGGSEFAALIAKARSDKPQRMTHADLDLAKRMTLMYGRGPKDRDPYPEEAEYYLHCIRKYNLDPMQRQICAVWRYDSASKDEVMTAQTQIDGYRVLAARTNQYAGSDDPVFNTADNGTIISCMQTVWRIVKNVRCPFTATAYWAEYKPGGGGGFMWDKMPHTMIAKCAEALALRKAFPADLGGLYIDAEMDQSNVAPPADAPLRSADAPSAPTRRERQNPTITVEHLWGRWFALAKTLAETNADWAEIDANKAKWFRAYIASVLGHDVPDPRQLPQADMDAIMADLTTNNDARPLDERTE